MKQITRAAVAAFNQYQPFSRDNTKVEIHNGTANLFLFGNKIAFMTKNGDLFISNSGWQTNTTKERLNGLPNVSISQRKGQWYLNGNAWDGDWIVVNNDSKIFKDNAKSISQQLALF